MRNRQSGATLAVTATILSLFVLAGCSSPKTIEMPGTYVYTAGMYGGEGKHDISIFQLTADGHYVKHDPMGRIKNGTWKRTTTLGDSSIELDGDEFRLTYHDNRVCWEARRDYDYWCRT